MRDIAILTATYNHPQELAQLYATLLTQEDQGFTWIVVDDGSRPDTAAFLSEAVGEGKLDILSLRQENSGKSRAVNTGLDAMTDQVRAVVIVDDDEKLFPDAVASVRRYMERYYGTDCGVIHFNRMDENGKVIADPVIDEDFYMPFQQFKSSGRAADGYLCYFTDKLGKERFHIYPGEKYIAPSSLVMRVSERSSLLWAAAVLGSTEYLNGGITKQGRRLRLKNPRSMIEYCALMQRGGASFKTRMGYSVHAFAYREFLTDREKVNMNGFMAAAKLPGKLLAARWRRQYPLQ